VNIALCGPLGAGCTEVGQLLAGRLGMRCVNTGDVVRALIAEFRESYKEFEGRVRSGEVDLDKMIDGEIDELLEEGETVVEGRSGFMLLDNETVFKILLVAPRERRVKHIASTRGISPEEAEREIEASDKERRHMVERLFQRDWMDPGNYDLVVNTGSKGYEEVSEILVKAIKAFQKA